MADSELATARSQSLVGHWTITTKSHAPVTEQQVVAKVARQLVVAIPAFEQVGVRPSFPTSIPDADALRKRRLAQIQQEASEPIGSLTVSFGERRDVAILFQTELRQATRNAPAEATVTTPIVMARVRR